MLIDYRSINRGGVQTCPPLAEGVSRAAGSLGASLKSKPTWGGWVGEHQAASATGCSSFRNTEIQPGAGRDRQRIRGEEA